MSLSLNLVQTTALTIHADLELSTLSEEELRQVAEQLDNAARTVRGELARRWAAAGKPKSMASKLLDSLTPSHS